MDGFFQSSYENVQISLVCLISLVPFPVTVHLLTSNRERYEIYRTLSLHVKKINPSQPVLFRKLH